MSQPICRSEACSYTVAAVAAASIVAGVFVILASQQVLPNGVNAISQLGVGGAAIGGGALALGVVAFAIAVSRGGTKEKLSGREMQRSQENARVAAVAASAPRGAITGTISKVIQRQTMEGDGRFYQQVTLDGSKACEVDYTSSGVNVIYWCIESSDAECELPSGKLIPLPESVYTEGSGAYGRVAFEYNGQNYVFTEVAEPMPPARPREMPRADERIDHVEHVEHNQQLDELVSQFVDQGVQISKEAIQVVKWDSYVHTETGQQLLVAEVPGWVGAGANIRMYEFEQGVVLHFPKEFNQGRSPTLQNEERVCVLAINAINQTGLLQQLQQANITVAGGNVQFAFQGEE